LEEENKYLLSETRDTMDEPGIAKHIKYMLHLVESFEPNHYVRTSFDDRFARENLMKLAQSKNYNVIALKGMKFLNDVLTHIRPNGSTRITSPSNSRY
jgi:hypothetical protein